MSAASSSSCVRTWWPADRTAGAIDASVIDPPENGPCPARSVSPRATVTWSGRTPSRSASTTAQAVVDAGAQVLHADRQHRLGIAPDSHVGVGRRPAAAPPVLAGAAHAAADAAVRAELVARVPAGQLGRQVVALQQPLGGVWRGRSRGRRRCGYGGAAPAGRGRPPRPARPAPARTPTCPPSRPARGRPPQGPGCWRIGSVIRCWCSQAYSDLTGSSTGIRPAARAQAHHGRCLDGLQPAVAAGADREAERGPACGSRCTGSRRDGSAPAAPGGPRAATARWRARPRAPQPNLDPKPPPMKWQITRTCSWSSPNDPHSCERAW